jgi:hypothetical protein
VNLGRIDEARTCIARWREVWTGSMDDYRANNERWFFAQPELLRRVNDDLRVAGVDI